MRAVLCVAVLAVVGCGDEEEAAKPAGGKTAAAPAKPADKKKPTKQFAPMLHIEDRVACPTPTTAKKCDVKSPVCPKNEYCLPGGTQGTYCGPCPPRDDIRHQFGPRDFLTSVTGTENRDPFQSFIVVQPGMAPDTSSTAIDQTQVCTKPQQFQAPAYSVVDLTLVGIVSQGTQRRVLLIDNTNYGYTIRKGDCVGKEKALVKEIGANYITFQLSPDPTNPNQREPSEHSKQLYNDPVSMNQQLKEQGKATTGANGAVISAPPSVGPAVPSPAPMVGPNPDTSVPAPPP